MLNIMAKHVFTGVFIPAKIWIAKDLIPQEKMMLAEIKALSEDSGWCFAGNKHFAEWLGCGTSNISNYIQRFQREGMIEVTYNDKKTFSGRRMRVNLEWYHSLSTPFIETETPYTGNVPPFSGNEAPYTGAVTERQFKSTSKPNERGGALNESQSLKAEEVKRGMYAPPAEAAAPPKDEHDAFSEWLPSLHKAQERNAPGAMPVPTHTITTIDPAEPGLKAVSPFVMPRRVETVDEAEEIIMEWAKGEGRESVRKWYSDAARQCTAVDVTAMVAKFAGVYLTIGDEGKRQRMAQDPLQFFKYTFKSFLKTEKSFSAKVMPGASSQQSNSPVPANIRRL